MAPIGASQPSHPWRVLALLFLANLLNFFDRTIPGILIEPIRLEWGLNDLQLGIITAAFTVIYAVAGLPLGRLADRGSRKKVIGWGVALWSAFTAANAFAWSFGSFLVARMGVGVGRPATRRPRARSSATSSRRSGGRGRWGSSCSGCRWG